MKKNTIPGLKLFIVIGLVLLVFIMIYEGVTGGKENAALDAFPDNTETDTIPEETQAEVPVFATDRERAEYMIEVFANELGIHYTSYPEDIVAMLEKYPETEPFVRNYPLEYGNTGEIDLSDVDLSEGVPLFLQWDPRWGYMIYGNDVVGLTGCGPVCLSMAAYYLTGGDEAMTPDKIIEFAVENGYYVAGSGSSWTLISEGARLLGLQVRELPLLESDIAASLQSGEVIICNMGPGDFTTTGHYIVLTGYENGMVSINDPNSTENSGKLWSFADIQSQIENIWALGA